MNAGIIAVLFVVIILLAVAVQVLLKPSKERLLRGFGQTELTVPKMNQSDISKLLSFLEEADNAYIRAYQYRSLGELVHYTTRELAMEMQQKITYYNDKIWGTPAHRQRTWSVVSVGGAIITVRKELTFKKVKYGRIKVKLGDDCVEYWKIIFDNLEKRYKIQEITY